MAQADPEFSTQPPTGLTFGIELEFLFLLERRGRGDPHPDDPRPIIREAGYRGRKVADEIRSLITTALNEGGICAINKSPPIRPELLPEEAQARIQSGHHWQSSCWTVGDDGSVMKVDEDTELANYQCIDVELNSPVHNNFSTFLEDVAKVCRVLRSRFRLAVNRTTGCHVHLSEERGLVKGVSLLTAKKAMSLYVLSERQLFNLCAPHRDESIFCTPLVSHSWVLAAAVNKFSDDPSHMTNYIPDNFTGLMRRILRLIWSSRSLVELMENITAMRFGGAHGAVKIATPNEDTPYDSWIEKPRTIEARLLQGTLDPQLVGHWVLLMTAWMGRAVFSEAGTFKQALEAIQSRRAASPYSQSQFLEDFGLTQGDPVSFWSYQALYYQSGRSSRDLGRVLPPL